MRRRRALPPSPESEPWLGRAVFRAAVLLAAVAAFLIAVVALGRYALEQLRGSDRYALPLAAIECEPPPGLSRDKFLEQIQYYAALPDRLDLLENHLAKRLADGFALHPWVREVERVEVSAKGVRASLAYRRPALAVRHGGQTRVVDSQGVLLPKEASADGLPVYGGEAPPPKGPAGTRWGDRGVEAAAQKAGR